MIRNWNIALLTFTLFIFGCERNNEYKTDEKPNLKETVNKKTETVNKKQEKEKMLAENALRELRKLQACIELGCKLEAFDNGLIEAKVKVNEATSFLPEGDIKTNLSGTLNDFINKQPYIKLKSATDKSDSINSGFETKTIDFIKITKTLDKTEKLISETYK